MERTLLEKDQEMIWHPYTQMKTAAMPLAIVKGEKEFLITESGERLIDGISSWWVNIHGHSHPYIADKIAAQARELEHVIFAGFTHPPAVELAERLLKRLPSSMKRVFYSDNGSTAVEIAMKMAIQYYYNRGQQRERLLAFDSAFHGETFGAMAATGQLSFNDAFSNQLFEVDRIPEPVKGQEEKTIAALEERLKTGSYYAFIFEPLIMGAGGMLMYTPEVLDRLIALCQSYDVLTIADEVMTGFYRTGRCFATDYLEFKPDLMCLAKGLTGGVLPLAITTCNEKVFDAFYSDDKKKAFFHGHSFTANPLGCAAGLASMDLLEAPDFEDNIAAIVKDHADFLAQVGSHPALKEVRQRGTIIALEFKTDSATSYFNNLRDQLYYFFLERGMILRPLGNVIYFMPPYCISKTSRQQVYQAIRAALDHFATA